MKGRFLSIKKSTWLLISAIFNFIVFVTAATLSFTIYKQYDMWFFILCLCIGQHLIFKSFLFRFDSCLYYGTVLFLVGVLYPFAIYLQILRFYPVFILLAFAAASLFTFYFYNQPYHLILALSLFFVIIGLILFLINIISIWIFLAIIGASVVLLIIRFFTLK